MLNAVVEPKNTEDKFAVVIIKNDYRLSTKRKNRKICKNI